MNDGPHVGLGDAHAEGNRGYQHRHIVTNEACLVFAALFAGHARMIGQRVDAVAYQRLAEIIDTFAAVAVDDGGRAGLLAQQLQQFAI